MNFKKIIYFLKILLLLSEKKKTNQKHNLPNKTDLPSVQKKLSIRKYHMAQLF